MNGESSINIYAPSGVRWIADETLPSLVLCDGLEGLGEGRPRRRGCMIMADSHCHMAETNPTLQKKKKGQKTQLFLHCLYFVKNLNSMIKKFCSVMQKRMEGMPKNYLLADRTAASTAKKAWVWSGMRGKI